MARAKKTEETSATATEETVVGETATVETTPAAETTAETIEANDPLQQAFVDAVNEGVAADAARAPELTGIEITHTSMDSIDNMLPEAFPFKPTDIPTTQEAAASVVSHLMGKLGIEEPVTQEERDEFMKKLRLDLDTASSKIVIVEESTPAPEPLSARASETQWKETHRVITDDMTCLVMVGSSYAWTHPEWDSPSGSPLLRKDDNGAWVLIDGEPFTGRIVSLDPPAPDRHTHRRQ